MHKYKVTTSTGETYVIKVTDSTLKRLLKDKVITKYEKVK